jgi:dTDP-4-dehydrorhamnose 3,5-epimerase
MKLIDTYIKDLFIIEPNIYKDQRGYFFEPYNKSSLAELGLHYDFVQDNQSYSKYGTIRGLHFQTGNYSQAKLVRVIKGEILDVAVDLRQGSPTFGKHFSIILDDKKNNQLMIPRGFAHGFSVISIEAIFSYKCDNYYNKESESGILFSDKDLNINWKVPTESQMLSDKDLLLQQFKDLKL